MELSVTRVNKSFFQAIVLSVEPEFIHLISNSKLSHSPVQHHRMLKVTGPFCVSASNISDFSIIQTSCLYYPEFNIVQQNHYFWILWFDYLEKIKPVAYFFLKLLIKNKHLFSIYYVPNTIPVTEDIVVKYK